MIEYEESLRSEAYYQNVWLLNRLDLKYNEDSFIARFLTILKYRSVTS